VYSYGQVAPPPISPNFDPLMVPPQPRPFSPQSPRPNVPPQPPKPPPGSKGAKRQAEMQLIAASTPPPPQQGPQGAQGAQQPFPGTQRQTATQAPPGGSTPPPTGAPPPPAGNSNTDAVPQEGTPVFKPPQYHQPAKGLEYALLGLSLLFPGAPISKLAAGALGGLQQGAENRFNRDEQSAQSQYQQEAAQMKSSYTNAVAQYNAAQDLRDRGIDPRTQQPFQLPPNLQRILPPGAGRAPGAMDYFRHETELANFYEGVGAHNVAAEHRATAGNYEREAIDQANNARSLQQAAITQQGEDRRLDKRDLDAENRALTAQAAESQRADKRLAVEINLEQDRQNREDTRQDRRFAHDDAKATLANPEKQAKLREEASRTQQQFYAAWSKALRPPRTSQGQPVTLMDPKTNTTMMNPDGTPKTAPAAIGGDLVKRLMSTFSLIDRNPDPINAADYYAQSLGKDANPVAKELLTERGRYAELKRRSEGKPITPQKFAAPPTPAADTGPKIPGAFSNGKHGYQQGGKHFLDDGTPVDENGNAIRGGSDAKPPFQAASDAVREQWGNVSQTLASAFTKLQNVGSLVVSSIFGHKDTAGHWQGHVANSAHYDGRAIDVAADAGGALGGYDKRTWDFVTNAVLSGGWARIGTNREVVSGLKAWAAQHGVDLFEDDAEPHVHLQVGAA